MLSIAMHISLSAPNTPDINECPIIDKLHDITNSTPIIFNEKDIPLASLSTARCGFGIVSTDDTIYAVGQLFEI